MTSVNKNRKSRDENEMAKYNEKELADTSKFLSFVLRHKPEATGIVLDREGWADRYFDRGMVVFFAGGTGHPYFSTDTGVVLRAVEVEAEVILLAKAIDGVYDDDPKKNPAAKKYDEVTIDEVIAKNLQVVDMTASILARDNKMPMLVFGLNEENSIVNTVKGKFNGTKVTV